MALSSTMNGSLSPRNYSLPIDPQFGMASGDHLLICAGILASLIWSISWTGDQGCFEFIIVIVMSSPEDTNFFLTALIPIFQLLHYFLPLISEYSLSLVMVVYLSHLWLSTKPLILSTLTSWISLHCTKRLFWPKLRAIQVFWW